MFHEVFIWRSWPMSQLFWHSQVRTRSNGTFVFTTTLKRAKPTGLQQWSKDDWPGKIEPSICQQTSPCPNCRWTFCTMTGVVFVDLKDEWTVSTSCTDLCQCYFSLFLVWIPDQLPIWLFKVCTICLLAGQFDPLLGQAKRILVPVTYEKVWSVDQSHIHFPNLLLVTPVLQNNRFGIFCVVKEKRKMRLVNELIVKSSWACLHQKT